ncbi:uncharacterized protein PHALS_03560 [Plasmopara halstedii]|uniref:Uncharacterized protein n=1 Tax=Plasmopara halstedii TaxID=4781 RepID=A0A0P1AZA2_PLAHL|nr:uncharacterized protein PHALS_03560 [Plasmopara halstedii]CEG46886.1 hypothetical protein PHALS_03560 [Plasmopara halstedii]|eukprot:XP_024583255.1 hypothetical protein PHALS_03560 [Plasmopara halstedii]
MCRLKSYLDQGKSMPLPANRFCGPAGKIAASATNREVQEDIGLIVLSVSRASML